MIVNRVLKESSNSQMVYVKVCILQMNKVYIRYPYLRLALIMISVSSTYISLLVVRL